MLENGFSMSKVEVYNWGNFQGYQKFNLRSENTMPGLFSEPPTSAILGVNGSGKSTLIDGIMIALLPFEKSLKLGITNDVESGSSGGRNIKDYVLGKFASTGIHSEMSRDSAYSRETGCSIFLLSFQHNSSPQKVLNLGRIWWYKNGKVADNDLFFICHSPLTLMDLTLNGSMPTSPRIFKEDVCSKKSSFEVFETAESYFTSMSICLGGVRREDLKLFNRAFYIKSISNIDQFIRENMLFESESTNLNVLLENVRNGNDIKQSIQTCEEKLKLAAQIIKQLLSLETVTKKQQVLLTEKAMLALFSDWNQLRQNQESLKKYSADQQIYQQNKPQLFNIYEELQMQLESKKSQLSKNDLHLQEQIFQEKIKTNEQQITELKRQETTAASCLEILKIKAPKKTTDAAKVQKEIHDKELEINTRQKELRELDLRLLSEKSVLETQTKIIKDELQHLQNNKTLIPERLYKIKLQAIQELQIPKTQLMFVGELIQIRPEHQTARRACEAALDPISRNLLCHPDSLDKFTKWLNHFGNTTNVSVKRITEDELKASLSKEKIPSQSILHMMTLLDKSKNPFSDYLQNWLTHSFDFQIVSSSDFKKLEGRLVTLEGLVRADRRTMKKLQIDMKFYLGWDTQEQIDRLIANLHEIQKKENDLKNEQKSWNATNAELRCQSEALIRIQSVINFDYLQIPAFEQQNISYQNECENLRSKNKDYDLLQSEILHLSEKVRAALEAKTDTELKLKETEHHIAILSKLIPVKQKEFETLELCAEHLGRHHHLNEIELYLQEILKKTQAGRPYAQISSELDHKTHDLGEQARDFMVGATRTLQIYERDFHDANLSYRVPSSSAEQSQLYNEWLKHQNYLNSTELIQAKSRFKDFFDKVLVDSVKTTINEFKSQVAEIQRNIISINEVLKLTNYEDLPTEKRYLQIINQASEDERIRRFKKQISQVEGVLAPLVRAQVEEASGEVMQVLMGFVENLQKDSSERYFVTDIRNHFYFHVHSIKRGHELPDTLAEKFTGSKKDAKSSAQTTQLAYALLASALAYRFKFNDPVAGRNTPRTLILDEFGGKFDNEKPKDIVLLLEKMGFQSILVSPMSKADLLADRMSHLVLVHKISASHSKVQSKCITSKAEYDRVLREMAGTEL